jgi:SpoVK/Ycf46/Vps4 family AAA+-type ATPase
VDVQLTLDRLFDGGNRHQKRVGIPGVYLSNVVQLIAQNPAPAPLQWETYSSGAGQTVACATNALYMLRRDSGPFCVMVAPRGGGDKADRKQMELSVLAPTREQAQSALDGILERARRESIFRGKMIALEKSEDPREPFAVKFLELPKVQREEIILPAAVMEVIERNVAGTLAHRKTLARAGVATRRGVLFHGPPGTGKTLVTRYFSGALPGCTVIVLTGRQLRLIRESCQLARLLSPSIIILEDVDLVASERRRNRHNTILHELMDEMDGLGEKTECVFLLTTNRPDILEPALAARPGRVDQAIYFPLPDAECRRRLLRMYGRQADLSGVEIEQLVTRTEGASPAFLKELVGRAVVMAAERGEEVGPVRLVIEDFDRAIRELLEFGGALTQQLLGYRGRTKDNAGI